MGAGGVLVADMHELTLIHTDLKPENILLVSSEYVKVPDYKVMSYKALGFITCCLSSQGDLTIIIHLKVAWSASHGDLRMLMFFSREVVLVYCWDCPLVRMTLDIPTWWLCVGYDTARRIFNHPAVWSFTLHTLTKILVL